MIRTATVYFLVFSTLSGNAYSHHGIPGNIDFTRQTLISGEIEFVEWINPHVLIHIVSSTGRGLEQRWTVFADAPSDMLSRGLSRELLDIMGTARFTIYQSGKQPCSTECTGYGYSLLDSNGRVFILHKELYEVANQLNIGN